MIPVLKSLLSMDCELVVIVVCGENEAMRSTLEARYGAKGRVRCHGVAESLEPFLKAAGSIVTKPGISTLLEARAAGRKIFLLKGMPVAEDHNLRYALARFGAERYTPGRFCRWLKSRTDLKSASPGSREGENDLS
jgi:processive 1,2-diacylglycerol beta-glucosyltransferase